MQVIATGEVVSRPWYRDAALPRKAPPRHLIQEPGAVLTRAASSFHRFGHLELHAMRKEFREMRMLADYIIERYQKLSLLAC